MVVAPALALAADPSAFTSTFVARWNLNHGEYLIDIGEYLEALEAFDTAMEMADVVEVQTEARLQKAAVLALFLDAPDAAVTLYDDLMSRYPQSTAAEAAQFRAGMVLFDREQYARAAAYFERYLERHPEGPSRGSAEFLLQRSRAEAGRPVSPTLAATAAPSPLAPTATATAVATAVPPTPTAPATAAPAATRALPPPATQIPMHDVTPVRVPSPAGPDAPSIADVRIRVFKGQTAVRVAADGLQVLPLSSHGGGPIELSARAGMVVVGGSNAPEVSLRARGPIELRAGRTVRHYRGSFTVRADGNTLRFINRVGIEEYLYGVVTKESVPSWPIEALKTQAIASRTYALYQVQHRQQREYDMVDDEGSQVYGGTDGEHVSGRRAVDETRGMVLVYKGKPIYAMFTSNTGWHTGDPKFIFDQPLAYLAAVPDPYSPSEQLGRWTRKHSAAEVRRALADIGVRLGPLRAIRPQFTCPSGRIVRVAIEDDRGPHAMRTRPTLARALKLPEILLDIRRDGDTFVFAGGGFGHGVGLSQWGAKHMASKGFTAPEILDFYYRGTELTTLAGR
jgi:stage II sporulation protein D